VYYVDPRGCLLPCQLSAPYSNTKTIVLIWGSLRQLIKVDVAPVLWSLKTLMCSNYRVSCCHQSQNYIRSLIQKSRLSPSSIDFFCSGLEDRRGSISGRWYKRLCKLRAVILFIQIARHTCKKVSAKYRQNLIFKTDSNCRGADKSLARPGRKQATATEDFDFDISYL